jgi:hypothetical protein
MNGIVDNSLVGLALLVSLGYAVSSLGPKSLRRRLLAALSRATARAPALPGLRRLSGRLAAAAGKAQGTCGGCDDCGTAQPSAPQSSAPPSSAENSPAGEIRVPVGKIGRRI